MCLFARVSLCVCVCLFALFDMCCYCLRDVDDATDDDACIEYELAFSSGFVMAKLYVGCSLAVSSLEINSLIKMEYEKKTPQPKN